MSWNQCSGYHMVSIPGSVCDALAVLGWCDHTYGGAPTPASSHCYRNTVALEGPDLNYGSAPSPSHCYRNMGLSAPHLGVVLTRYFCCAGMIVDGPWNKGFPVRPRIAVTNTCERRCRGGKFYFDSGLGRFHLLCLTCEKKASSWFKKADAA